MTPAEPTTEVSDAEWAGGEELVLTTGNEGEWVKLDSVDFEIGGERYEPGRDKWL